MLLSLLKLALVLCLADIVMSQSGNIGTGVTDEAGTAITVSLGDVILIGAVGTFGVVTVFCLFVPTACGFAPLESPPPPPVQPLPVQPPLLQPAPAPTLQPPKSQYYLHSL